MEPLIVLLLFSLFFAMMVVIVLYMSFHGFGSSSNPSANEGSIIIQNFKEASPVFLKLIQDDKTIFNNFMAKDTSVVWDWTQSHTIQYIVANDADLSDVIVSNIVAVDKNSLISVIINPDGTSFELFSSRVTQLSP